MTTLSLWTVAAILCAAVLHASWNALGKSIPDRVASGALIGVASAVIGLLAVPFLPLPAGPAWPFIVASTVVQSLYLTLLMATYRYGDFSQTYPVTRGIAPVLVTVVSLTVLHEQLSIPQLVGVAVVCGGLLSMVFSSGVPQRGNGYGLAALTGVTIAAYTIIDGLGVRRAGSGLGGSSGLHAGSGLGGSSGLHTGSSLDTGTASAVSYAMWLFVLQGPVMVFLSWLQRRGRLRATLQGHWRVGLAGGVLSVTAYAIVIWAQSRAPLASVATLRETSVLFAAFLGRLLFAEKVGVVKVAAACVVGAGIVTIALA